MTLPLCQAWKSKWNELNTKLKLENAHFNSRSSHVTVFLPSYLQNPVRPQIEVCWQLQEWSVKCITGGSTVLKLQYIHCYFKSSILFSLSTCPLLSDSVLTTRWEMKSNFYRPFLELRQLCPCSLHSEHCSGEACCHAIKLCAFPTERHPYWRTVAPGQQPQEWAWKLIL